VTPATASSCGASPCRSCTTSAAAATATSAQLSNHGRWSGSTNVRCDGRLQAQHDCLIRDLQPRTVAGLRSSRGRTTGGVAGI
jgi:hypothetical protein